MKNINTRYTYNFEYDNVKSLAEYVLNKYLKYGYEEVQSEDNYTSVVIRKGDDYVRLEIAAGIVYRCVRTVEKNNIAISEEDLDYIKSLLIKREGNILERMHRIASRIPFGGENAYKICEEEYRLCRAVSKRLRRVGVQT